MNAHQMERAAYIAAHRIMTTDLNAPELACPGARRSAVLDNIAKIITSVYEAHSQRFDETTDWWQSYSVRHPRSKNISEQSWGRHPSPVGTRSEARSQ